MLAYDRSGSGPPLVLVHGIGLDHRCWDPVVPLLAGERDVVAVDLPGFGGSAADPRVEPAVGALADAVEELIRELGLERPHVAGNSLGGAVALELGARGVAASACGLSPVGFTIGREWIYQRASLRLHRAVAKALDPVAERALGGPTRRTLLLSQDFGRPWRVPPDAATQMLRTFARCPGFERTLPVVSRWRPTAADCPTTIAWAEHDRLLLTSRQAPRAGRMLPRARHLILNGCGHVPMWDDPPQVARVLREASGG